VFDQPYRGQPQFEIAGFNRLDMCRDPPILPAQRE
jgi:hypothetical protein